MRLRSAFAVAALSLLCACTHDVGATSPRAPPAAAGSGTFEPAPARDEVQVGYASWYGAALAGHRTASGERFDPGQMTAAHRTLPFDTWVEVKRVDTGDTVRVRITDRGPWGHEDRVIDLSRAAAAKLGMLKRGLTRVELHVVRGP